MNILSQEANPDVLQSAKVYTSKKDNVPLFNEVRDLDYLYTFIFAVNIVVT